MRVTQFFDAMQQELENNSHKRGWDDCSTKWLLNRARQELAELERAIERKDFPSHILSEAADVANFSFMVADVYQNQFREEGANEITR